MMSSVSRVLCILISVVVTGCAGGGKPVEPAKPVDIEIANSIAAAESAYARGAIADAAILFQRALIRARAMDDPNLIAQNAYNAAACSIALGRYETAANLLNESLDETLRDGGNTSDVLVLMAKVAWLRGQPDEAMAFCDQALTGAGAKPTDAHRVQVHLLRGQIDCGKGDMRSAEAELLEAKKLAGLAPSPARAAGLENLAGLIDQLAGRFAPAAAAFDREADDYRTARLYRDMARALGRAGAAYESASDFKSAGERFYRAARATLAQGDETLGRHYLDKALINATNASDQKTLAKARDLKADKETRAGPTTAP